MARVTIDDLRMSAEWLRSYSEDDEDAEERGRCVRVAAWLDAEAKRREEDSLVHAVAKRTGRADKLVRAALVRAGEIDARTRSKDA